MRERIHCWEFRAGSLHLERQQEAVRDRDVKLRLRRSFRSTLYGWVSPAPSNSEKLGSGP